MYPYTRRKKVFLVILTLSIACLIGIPGFVHLNNRSRQVGSMPEIVTAYSAPNIEMAEQVNSTVYLEHGRFIKYANKAIRTFVVGEPDGWRGQGKMQSFSVFVEIPGSNTLYGSELPKPKGNRQYSYVLERFEIDRLKDWDTIRIIWKPYCRKSPYYAVGFYSGLFLLLAAIAGFSKTHPKSSTK